MSEKVEFLSESEVECCKEELTNYIEFMQTSGDNAGWARGLKWYIEKLESQLTDNTANKVVKEEIEKLENRLIRAEKNNYSRYTPGECIPILEVLECISKKILKGEKE